MEYIIYDNFFFQMLLFGLFSAALIIPAVSIFLKPAKRTIRASLVNTKTGHIIDIDTAESSIGRSRTCDIVLGDQSVSRAHAVLSYRQKDWYIFDTRSTAGVLLNGQKIEKHAKLQDGDVLKFGNEQYSFYSTAVTTREKKVKKYKTQPEDHPVYKSPARSNEPEYRTADRPAQNDRPKYNIKRK